MKPDDALRTALEAALTDDEGQMQDAFGLWVAGKRDDAWIIDRMAAAPAMQAVLTVLREAELLHQPLGFLDANYEPGDEGCRGCDDDYPCRTRTALDTIGGGR